MQITRSSDEISVPSFKNCEQHGINLWLLLLDLVIMTRLGFYFYCHKSFFSRLNTQQGLRMKLNSNNDTYITHMQEWCYFNFISLLERIRRHTLSPLVNKICFICTFHRRSWFACFLMNIVKHLEEVLLNTLKKEDILFSYSMICLTSTLIVNVNNTISMS